MLNVLFMGTPDFAEKSLEKLYNTGHNILTVVTNPDKPKGRGMKLIASPVKEFAIAKNIPVKQPKKVKNNQDFIEEIRNLNPDVICVVAYGKILPKEILEIPKYGAINVHGSLLPKYRGAAPIQWAIINGDKTTGVTTMYMNEEMDAGDIILKKEIIIGEDETTGELWKRMSEEGAELLVKTLDNLEQGIVKREKQSSDFSLAPMIDKRLSKIDWNKNAIEIKNLVRGLNPIIGTYTYHNEKKLKIWRVNIIENTEYNNCKAGEVVFVDNKKGVLQIKTADKILEILEIQPENSKKMAMKEYLNGTKIAVGEKFV